MVAHVYPAKHRLNADDYLRMAEIGILREEHRVQLIDGEILDMSPAGVRHSAVVGLVAELLAARVAQQAYVRTENPLRLGDLSLPEPDVAVVRGSPRDYLRRYPTEADVLLLVEVGDSSAAFDRTTKAALYARYAVAEYWVVDLAADEVVVHTDPQPSGYASVRRVARGQAWTSPVLDGSQVRGEDVLG